MPVLEALRCTADTTKYLKLYFTFNLLKGSFIRLLSVMEFSTIGVREIVGNVKNYDWGKLGVESIVAQLAALNSNAFKIDAATPYSELWMGNHPSGPSIIKATGESLGRVLPQSLPFLFKVLSIRKALSIQVHPNKEDAKRLHEERPDIYKDPNHKPELAIALTPFLALCGFRPYTEIYEFCQLLPPLQELLGGNASVQVLQNGSAADLRKCYEKLMTSNDVDTAACIDQIANNFTDVLAKHEILEVFQTTNRHYPQDVGLLSLFFLNIVRLEPGKAIFLGANEIHAYLLGDCIECMACSDNVIRAGLTPKYKDVAQLISSLNYDGQPAKNKIFEPKRIDEYLQIFAPPVDDFAVMQVILPPSMEDYKLPMKPYDSIILVLHGERTLRLKNNSELILKRGSIVYIPPDIGPEVQLSNACKSNEDFTAYIATYNSFKN